MKRKIALEASRTLALYGFAGWVYIALVALVHPHTLVLQLTHFTKLPHEDTFGETCFVVSLVSFFIYSMLRSTDKPADRLAVHLLSVRDHDRARANMSRICCSVRPGQDRTEWVTSLPAVSRSAGWAGSPRQVSAKGSAGPPKSPI
jgi:hypothetical protein